MGLLFKARNEMVDFLYPFSAVAAAVVVVHIIVYLLTASLNVNSFFDA